MELLNYRLKQNDDKTYFCEYDFMDDNGICNHVEAQRVELSYIMQPLYNNSEGILFPNIRGCCILNKNG